MSIVVAHIAGVPVEEWLPFVAPVVALYLYGRHRDRRRGQAVRELGEPTRALDARTVGLVLGDWQAADHGDLAAEHVPLFYPPGLDGLTASQLAARCAGGEQEVQRQLEDLEQLGYVELDQPDDAGERRAWLSVTGYDALLVAENALVGAASARAAGPAKGSSRGRAMRRATIRQRPLGSLRGAAALVALALLAPAAPCAAATRRALTLQWVGDIALSAQQGLPPGGLEHALAPVRSLLDHGDITLGNLEGTLSVGGSSKCAGASGGSCFAFQAPPLLARQLRAVGFGLLNQANNHSLDYGVAGRSQTLSALRAAGVAHTGLPGEITYLRLAGQTVAFLGFAPYAYDANLLDIPAAKALVHRARAHASLVVVIIHAGAEGPGALHTPRGEQYFLGEDRGNARAFAHAVIDAGASIVLGSGPHVIRGVERYRGHLIAYSLGNFVGYHTLAGGGVLSLSAILRVTLGAGGRLLAARWIPLQLVDGLPRPDPTGASTQLMIALSRADFTADRFAVGPSGRFHLAPLPRARSAWRAARSRLATPGARRFAMG